MARARLRIVQLNVLAPSARICEPLGRLPWRERHAAACDALASLRPDVICLQEYDFCPGTEGFTELYREKLPGYALFTAQRTGHKVDGLALALRDGVFEDVHQAATPLQPSSCDRVVTIATMVHRASGRRVAVANTHLTVAHVNAFDIPLNRPWQMKQVLELLAAAAPVDGSPVARFCCGDLNSDHMDTEAATGECDMFYGHQYSYSAEEVARPVHMAFEQGFRSALHESLAGGVRPISHTSGYTRDGCTDYVLYAPEAARLEEAWLFPRDIPPDRAWSPSGGWGAALDARATFSDHRPLVADFTLGCR
mmetsp:Transcript_39217/g.110862  ORF Transcript_39217/g.110862 Transcript_39217/m.110862 type:complete len:309 (+) Transcript_39217:58-984(+)